MFEDQEYDDIGQDTDTGADVVEPEGEVNYREKYEQLRDNVLGRHLDESLKTIAPDIPKKWLDAAREQGLTTEHAEDAARLFQALYSKGKADTLTKARDYISQAAAKATAEAEAEVRRAWGSPPTAHSAVQAAEPEVPNYLDHNPRNSDSVARSQARKKMEI